VYPEWLMPSSSFGLESSGLPDITVRMGKPEDATAESRGSDSEPLTARRFPQIWPCLHIRLRNFDVSDSRNITVICNHHPAVLD